MKGLIEFIKEPILAVLAALLISGFIISHTKIPTGSMMYTINPGDHLIVSRLQYYYRNPKRGEIIVFEQKMDKLIKRVIGLPGETINIVDGNVYINDQKLEENYLINKNTTYLFSDSDIVFPYTIPENMYFVMGDNRENSLDSRYFGPIHRSKIIAKSGLRIYPFSQTGMVE